MEQEIIDRAKWLYCYNGGNLTINECVKRSLKEHNSFEYRLDAIDRYLLFQITNKEYIKYLEERVRDSLLWRE